MNKYCLITIIILLILSSCEEVIEIDLNEVNPSIVAEAVICKDSVGLVLLTQTSSYFSVERPSVIDNATVTITRSGTSSEELSYIGDGYYKGNNITGLEDTNYDIEIIHDGVTYDGISYMPFKTDIVSVSFSKSDTQSPLNPFGETVFTVRCEFSDNPDIDNFYMVRYIADGELLERYYLLTENSTNSGSINYEVNGNIRFSESIFYDGGEVEVQLFSIDESVYNYFLQLTDVLFWKRRVISPTPYNPGSNINNGALGYFAAWTFDSEIIILE